MSFKTKLSALFSAGDAVSIGVGALMHPSRGVWVDPRGEEAMEIAVFSQRIYAHDQEIEVDDTGCAIFEDTEGTKHAVQVMVMRPVLEVDVQEATAEFHLLTEEKPDGIPVH